MSFLYPSLFGNKATGESAESLEVEVIDADTSLGRAFEAAREERKEKYLEIIGAVIDAGFTEKGIVMFLQAKLRPLDDMSITEYLTEHEGDITHERVMGALAVWRGEY